jgi:ribulose-5-phosphate 4-epimerase/fuculose-1-phosphate aldolase
MILRNHGLLALGETVREAFDVMYYLDTACQIQVDAMAGGMENVLRMSEQAAKTAAEQFVRPGRPAEQKDWPALLRMLDRKGVRYAE